MKVINIETPYDLEGIDIENDDIDVFVTTDDGYSYTLSFATSKHLQFLMDKEKMEYYGPGYPFIIVNKLTPEIIEKAVKAFAEKDGGYWLKVYHFGGLAGYIEESMFNQLKEKHIKERKQFAKLNALDLIQEAKNILKDSVNNSNLIHLVEQYQSGNKHPGIRTRVIPGTCLVELRAKGGDRVYFREKNEKIEVVAIANKDNQQRLLSKLRLDYTSKNNF